ncbi:unnamed protein product [Scytosiphon promiscuus]
MVEPSRSGPSLKRAGEPSSLLYRAAARNLREYNGVPTMILLQLRPRRLVAQGLAPKKLLKGQVSAGEVIAGEIGRLGRLGSSSDSSSDSSRQIAEDSYDRMGISSSDSDNDGFDSNVAGGVEANDRPVHAALVAGGIKLRIRETRPLLRALGLGPFRLVKLGLVEHEVLLASMFGGGDGTTPRGVPQSVPPPGGEPFASISCRNPQPVPSRGGGLHGSRQHGRSVRGRRQPDGRMCVSSSPVHLLLGELGDSSASEGEEGARMRRGRNLHCVQSRHRQRGEDSSNEPHRNRGPARGADEERSHDGPYSSGNPGHGLYRSISPPHADPDTAGAAPAREDESAPG